MDNIEVVIGEVEIVKKGTKEEIHYIVSFGGDKSIRVIGKKNWEFFVEMIKWLDWNPEETQEIYIPQYDNFSEAETCENTVPRIHLPSKTLEYELIDLDNEIIDGIPIYDDE